MRVNLTYLTPLLAAGAAAAAIMTAPTVGGGSDALPQGLHLDRHGKDLSVTRQRGDHRHRPGRQLLSLREHALSAR